MKGRALSMVAMTPVASKTGRPIRARMSGMATRMSPNASSILAALWGVLSGEQAHDSPDLNDDTPDGDDGVGDRGPELRL
jgi:hypothetical protein